MDTFKEKLNTPEESEQEQTKVAFYKLYTEGIKHDLLSFPADWSIDQKKEHVIENITRAAPLVFPEYQAEIDLICAQFESAEFEGEQEMVHMIAEKLSECMASHFSLPELEQRLRERQLQQSGWKEINRMLFYEVDREKARLHIPTIFAENPLELRTLFKKGLRMLAEEMHDNDALKEVYIVSGESWIVFEHPKFMEKLGFIITNLNQERHMGTVEMSKEKLFELYLDKNN